MVERCSMGGSAIRYQDFTQKLAKSHLPIQAMLS